LLSLIEDLQTPKNILKDFHSLTNRVLNYLPHVITNKISIKGYILYSSTSAGTKKFVRPIKSELFIFNAERFQSEFDQFINILNRLKNGERKFKKDDYNNIDRTIYTIQHSIGIGLDLLGESNSSRKHVGNRFEDLIKIIINELGIANKKIVLNIPYKTDDGEKQYNCEIDIIFSPFKAVKSDSKNIDRNEVVVSLKTTTKDRMSKIFIDKLLMEKFVGHELKFIGISLNDVQRKGENNISYTFVSNLFMVYTEFLTKLRGFYYIDLPPKAQESPYNNHISTFSKFIIKDIWLLING